MASHTNYIGWLVGYSGLLGPVPGIMVADYFFIRKTNLDLQSLYHHHGPYEYMQGFNPRDRCFGRRCVRCADRSGYPRFASIV